MEKTQREYYLNEQLKAIQKELGEVEDGRDEVAELEDRINKTSPVQGCAREGSGRAEEAAIHEPDVGGSHRRAQLSGWIVSIPWKKRTKIKRDIKLAEGVLNTTISVLRRSRNASLSISPCSSA